MNNQKKRRNNTKSQRENALQSQLLLRETAEEIPVIDEKGS